MAGKYNGVQLLSYFIKYILYYVIIVGAEMLREYTTNYYNFNIEYFSR